MERMPSGRLMLNAFHAKPIEFNSHSNFKKPVTLPPIETSKGPGEVFTEYLKPRLSGEPLMSSQPRDWCKLQFG